MTWKTLYTFQTWIESEKLSEDSKLLAEKSIEKWTFLVLLLLLLLQNIAASNTDYTSMQYYFNNASNIIHFGADVICDDG